MRRLNPTDAARPRLSVPPRRPRRAWTRRIGLFAGFLLVVLVLVGGPVWIWRMGLGDVALEIADAGTMVATAELGLRVRQVYLQGRHEAPISEIRAAVPVRRGQPILSVDPREIKARLESLGWIRSAEVERRLPDIIHVRVEERRPLAIWQHRGRLVLIDEEGEVIGSEHLARFRHLPLLVGKGAPGSARELVAMLREIPELGRRVLAAVRVGERRWNIQLEGGVEVRLPEENPAAAWRRFAELERQYGLLARDLAVVDLRLPDRLVVRLNPKAVQRARQPSKNT